MKIVEDYDKPEWHVPTPNFLRRFTKAAICGLIILVLVLCLLEIVLRYSPRSKDLIFNDEYTGGHPMYVNTQHLREKVEIGQKPPGQIRILAVGNSITFGAGVAWDKAYPKQLNQILNENQHPGKYFVINAGGQGATMHKILDELPRQCVQYEPDIVTIGLSPVFLTHHLRQKMSKELEGKKIGSWSLSLKRLPLEIHVYLFQHSRLYPYFGRHARTLFYRLGVMTEKLNNTNSSIISYAFDIQEIDLNMVDKIERAYDNIEVSLVKLKKILDERNIKCVVVLLPDRFTISDKRVDNLRNIPKYKMRIDPIVEYTNILERNNCTFVPVVKRFRSERELMFSGKSDWNDLYIPDDNAHMNNWGHWLAAEEIYKVMQENNFLHIDI